MLPGINEIHYTLCLIIELRYPSRQMDTNQVSNRVATNTSLIEGCSLNEQEHFGHNYIIMTQSTSPTFLASLFPPKTNNYFALENPSHDEDLTVPLTPPRPRKQPLCKYCQTKLKLFPSGSKHCLIHALREKHPVQQLSDYLPTCRDLGQNLSISQSQNCKNRKHSSLGLTDEKPATTLSRQIDQLLENTKRVHKAIDIHGSGAHLTMIMKLKECISLLSIKSAQWEDQDSYTISLQLDASNDLDWIRVSNVVHPNIEEEGLIAQANSIQKHIRQLENRRLQDSFTAFLESVEQRLESNKAILKDYQCNMNQMNKRLLGYMEKFSSVGVLRDMEDDLNFIQHISSMGELTIKNTSNSSMMFKRKSSDFEDQDIMRFLLIQAATLENLLPTLNENTFE